MTLPPVIMIVMIRTKRLIPDLLKFVMVKTTTVTGEWISLVFWGI